MSVFINPFTDFGFKKLFGVENALPRLKSIIEDALELTESIVELSFMSPEQLGAKDDDRKAVYDIYCKSSSGSHFIVELQRAKQAYFKDRTLFYASFPIRSQAEKGEWNYQLCPVYCLAILDFEFSDTDPLRWHHVVQLKDQEGHLFYNKLTFAYLELPKFTKPLEECMTHLEKWCYALNNMDVLDFIPEELSNDKIIKSVFEEARFLGMDKIEQAKYEYSLKVYRDFTNVMDTAYDEGKEDARNEMEKELKNKDKELKCKDKELKFKDKELNNKTQEVEQGKQRAEREKQRAENAEKELAELKAMMKNNQ